MLEGVNHLIKYFIGKRIWGISNVDFSGFKMIYQDIKSLYSMEKFLNLTLLHPLLLHDLLWGNNLKIVIFSLFSSFPVVCRDLILSLAHSRCVILSNQLLRLPKTEAVLAITGLAKLNAEK